MSKNYLEIYAKDKTPKFQAGGEMAPPAEAAPAPQGGGASGIEGMLQQFAQTQDPQLAIQICNALIEQLQGGGAPAPAMANGGRMTHKAPIFKKGGKL